MATKWCQLGGVAQGQEITGVIPVIVKRVFWLARARHAQSSVPRSSASSWIVRPPFPRKSTQMAARQGARAAQTPQLVRRRACTTHPGPIMWLGCHQVPHPVRIPSLPAPRRPVRIPSLPVPRLAYWVHQVLPPLHRLACWVHQVLPALHRLV